jgi:hypothetical protein
MCHNFAIISLLANVRIRWPFLLHNYGSICKIYKLSMLSGILFQFFELRGCKPVTFKLIAQMGNIAIVELNRNFTQT